MKNSLTFLLLLYIYSVGFGQPGPGEGPPEAINLNAYKNFPALKLNDSVFSSIYFMELFRVGVIIIDKTSDLSRISLLKNEESLELEIDLSSIPKEFKDFTNTKSLKLSFIHLTELSSDLTFLNEFPNIKYLKIEYYPGEIIYIEKLVLDSLLTLEIDENLNLKNINSFSNNNSLVEIVLRNVPSLSEFPKFNKQNKIKILELDKKQNGRTTAELPKNIIPLNIDNLKYLNQLEDLTLYNRVYIE